MEAISVAVDLYLLALVRGHDSVKRLKGLNISRGVLQIVDAVELG